MTNHRNRFPARRRFLKQSAALSAQAAALTMPLAGTAAALPAAADAGGKDVAPGADAALPSPAAGSETSPIPAPSRRSNVLGVRSEVETKAAAPLPNGGKPNDDR